MVAVLGLALCAGKMQAVNLLQTTTTSVALTCSTVSGPTTANVVVKPAASLTTGSIYITLGTLPAGWSVSPSTQQTLTSANQSAGITYTFSLSGAAAGCVGFTPTSSTTFYFKAVTTSSGTAVNDVNFPISSVLAATTSGLTVSPTGTIALTCSLNGSTYIPQSPVTVSVSSSASTGTPFTVDTTLASAPATWITLSSTAGGTPTSTVPVTFTVAPTAGCGGFAAGSGAHTTTISLLNAPGPTKTITVTVTVTAAAASPLSVSPSGTLTVNCVLSGSTYTPYGNSQTISVSSAASGGTAFTVDTSTNPPATWLFLSSTSGGTATATPVMFTVNAAAGCGAQPLGTYTTSIHLLNLPAADKIIPVTMNVIAPPASSLLVSPASIALTCVLNGSYSTGPSQSVSVTSAANGGTSFTTASGLPSWLTLNPSSPSGTNVGATPVKFTASVTNAAACTGAVGTSKSTTIHLVDAPALDKQIPVTLMIVGPATLVATPQGSTSLSYTKGSGTPVYVDVKVTAPTSSFFAVDTTTLPVWLTVDSTTGTATPVTGKTIRFSSTSAADSLPPGNYIATVNLNVSAQAPVPITISLQVNNKTPVLSVVEGTTRAINWQVGTAMPIYYITLVSSDSPISYSLTTGGTLAPSIAQQSGLAYSFGSAIPVTFSPLALAAATPGTVLTGTVTIVWGPLNSTIVVTFNVNVQAAGATLTSISPATLPTAISGQTFTVGLVGTGFVQSTDITQKTTVGIVVNGSVVTDTNIAASVVNPSNILLTITVPATTDPYLPFAGGGPVVLGICNPSGSTCTAPTGTAVLSIGSIPIIQAVTSASAFQQVSSGSFQNVAPYDLISIFGSNFCSSGGTGCGSNTVLSASPDPVYRFYPTTLTPDQAPATIRNLSVTFYQSDQSTVIAQAPLLFATNDQINLAVPGTVSAHLGTIYVVVTFGASGCSSCSSAPFQLNAVATNPGIFTVGSDGQGDGAILSSSWATINGNNPAGVKKAAGGSSDTVQVYMTGLGLPDGTADNTSYTGTNTWPTDCITTGSYLASLPAGAPGTIDGAVIQSALLNTGNMAPCLITPLGATPNLPTAKIGNVTATVRYAGWVADSIAGLYQVNLQLPANSNSTVFTKPDGTTITGITAPVQLPVVVTANGVASQGNVTIWVAPRLTVVDPDGNPTGTPLRTLTEHCKAGASCTSTIPAPVLATGGQSPYVYAVTSGLLPAGLSLINGAITGAPGANTAGTYVLTITATDSSVPPVTGTVTFQLQVDGGLVVTGSPSTVTTLFGTPAGSTFLATGGTAAYNYVFTSPSSLPAAMSVGPTSGLFATTALTPAGTYTVSVTATDSSSPMLSGIGSLPVTVNLAISNTPLNPTANHLGAGAALVLTTVSTLGNTGNVTYQLDATSQALGYSISNAAGPTKGNITVDGLLGPVTSGTITVTATDDTVATGSSTPATYSLTINGVNVL